jgi:signal transduction histidine kinase
MYTDLSPRRILRKAFPGIREDEAFEMAAVGRVHDYPAGTVLCHEGANETIFYILLDGLVEVTKALSNLQSRVMKRLEAGEFFGEMALIHNMPRAATVTTLTPVTVLEIHKEDFTRLLERCVPLSLAMVREVSRRLRQNDEMAIEDLRVKAGELAEAYQTLAELEYARSEFLTTIAHELRTPLTAAGGFLQMIQKGRLNGQMLYTAVDQVTRNIQDIISLVNDILFIQEMDLILPDFTPTNIGIIIKDLVDEMQPVAMKNNVELETAVAVDIPMIAGDQKSLLRAFRAVLDNAIKFSLDGGVVKISVDWDQDNIWMSVQDRGVGIPEDAIERIFERFFHLDEINGHLFRGVGLGLSIAQQVIEQHRGRIEVESKLGEGSLFKIYLPARNSVRDSTT